MNSEGWAVQMRAFSRGSDGLAEVCEEDAKNVFVPVLSDDDKTLNFEEPEKRPSHIVLV